MVRISTWGQSPALRFPKQVMAETGWSVGQELDFQMVDGGVLLRPARASYTLADLASKMTPENRPEIVSWGSAVGNEAI